MGKIITIDTAAVLLLVLPTAASARTLLDTLSFFDTFLNAAVGLLITLAIVVFFWGLIKYIASVGQQKAEGLSIMFYGVIAIFVMVSIWGIVKVLQNTFLGGDAGIPVTVPRAPTVEGYPTNVPQ